VGLVYILVDDLKNTKEEAFELEEYLGLEGAPWLRRLGGILIAGNTIGLISEIYRSLRTLKRCDERPMWEKNSDLALFYY